MSKVSVFKFTMNNSDEVAKKIINQYLISRGLRYDNQMKCYRTRIQHSGTAKKIGAAVVSGLLTGGRSVAVKNSLDYGFEYYLNNGQLLIKAYLISDKLKSKMEIHSLLNVNQTASNYMIDLNCRLFKILKENNIFLESKEIEKIDDGAEKRNMLYSLKIIVLAFSPVILFILFFVILDLIKHA